VSSMSNDHRILIKNIYYMLAYAFRAVKLSAMEKLAAEEFGHLHDLMAEILAQGVAGQLKRGLYREYVTEREHLGMLRGKLELRETVQNRLRCRRHLVCEYDELSEKHLFHQILKTAMLMLLKHSDVSPERGKELKKLILRFDRVDALDPFRIPWNRLHYHRYNANYEFLMNICRFIFRGLLPTTEKGNHKMASFPDDRDMSALYEKFVLEYFRFHHSDLRPAASRVAWNVDGEGSDFLPVMQTDVTLRHGGHTLIVDTKYYSRIMQERYDRRTFHSGNLYQIFTYVKNQDRHGTGNAAGLLLYARTDEAIVPDSEFTISGNKFMVKTLDLNQDFRRIAAQLDGIAESVRRSS